MGRHKNQSEQTNLSWKDAIVEVLRTAVEAMPYTEIADQISERKLHAELGATPRSTVNAIISQSLKKDAPSPFERVQRGLYRLRNAPIRELDKNAFAEEELKEKVGVINAIGMYWERAKVDWSSVCPNIFGKETENATTLINFNEERGVYLLYDRQEPVYVGETKDQNLGKRIKQHTVDRHSGRWDRFSWFGVFKPKDDGTLDTDETFEHIGIDTIIVSMEAVLIELMGTRQNRQRGWDLDDHEYIQVEDPGFAKKRKKQLIEQLAAGLE